MLTDKRHEHESCYLVDNASLQAEAQVHQDDRRVMLLLNTPYAAAEIAAVSGHVLLSCRALLPWRSSDNDICQHQQAIPSLPCRLRENSKQSQYLEKPSKAISLKTT
jgi:hypothetical protein